MMRKIIVMKKVVILILICILFLTSASVVHGDSFQLKQPIPFGIAHIEGVASVPLYKSNNKMDVVTNLPDYQICRIKSTENKEDTVWFEIACILDGEEIEGYIDGTSFFQLTLAGLIRIMSNENIANYMQNYSLGIDAFVNNYSGEILRLAQADSENAETKDGYTYIKNIKTKKFHLPSCKSVNDINNKNLEEYTGTRESLIEQGYQPCKNCNP